MNPKQYNKGALRVSDVHGRKRWNIPLTIITRKGILHVLNKYIRPLAVSPLAYPERAPNPWGFFFFGTKVRTSGPGAPL